MTADQSANMQEQDAESRREASINDEYAALGRLLQGALAEPPQPRVQFLPAIQERIRKRTRGRYYKERSRAVRDPTLLLLAAACLLLVFAAFLYIVLEPLL